MRCITLLAIVAGALLSCGSPSLPDDPNHEPLPVPVHSAPTPIIPVTPLPTDKEKALADIKRVDPKGIVPANLMLKTMLYFNTNPATISNHNVFGVVDFSLHSSKPRFYIVRIDGGGVRVIHVAHGKNSDPSNSGYATLFGNVSGSEKSSLGFYLTAETVQHNGIARIMDGLSITNSNVRERAIWLHAAGYVMESTAQPGRSWGCLAVAYSEQNYVMSSFGRGGLIYAGLSKKE